MMWLWCSEAQHLVGMGSESPARVFRGLACFRGGSQCAFVQLAGRLGWAAGSPPEVLGGVVGCREAVLVIE